MSFKDTVDKALEQIRKRPANHDYFFSKLDSPEWIDPLAAAGLFSSPPPAIRDGSTIGFPFWPESQYLERMATLAPEKVADVMLKLPETDNIRVHEDFARAAMKLPVKLAAKWADKECRWLREQHHLYFLLPELLGELFARLAREGETHAALRLAKNLLAIATVEGASEGKAKFDDWHYDRVLRQHAPDLVSAAGIEGLTLLLELLEKALPEKDDRDDHSWIWRPAIEPHEQNKDQADLLGSLVDAVRDSIELLRKRGTAVDDMLRELRVRDRPIFRRLVLHLLVEAPDGPGAIEEATSKANFFDFRVWHEYDRLLRAVFPLLDPARALQILAWINEGPQVPADREEKEDIAAKRKASWQLRRLVGLRGHLPEEWEEKYVQLATEVGEQPYPEFVAHHASWVGPTSPKNEGELDGMSVREIADYLKQWRPTRDWKSPSPEGLGRVLQSVVAQSPQRFIEGLQYLQGIDPTYARSIVQGLTEAARERQELDWANVLEYVRWIVTQPRETRDDNCDGLFGDPHWGWARRAAASLLSMLVQKDAITVAMKATVWEVLLPLTDDPDPKQGGDMTNMDPATLSINTTRGEAMHAAVQYALWLYRGAKRAAEPNEVVFDFSVIEEVRDCLQRHLDPTIDPSPAIRSVYGQWLPWLLLMDEAWVKERLPLIFPKTEPDLRNAAWQTYLRFCPAYESVFGALRSEYEDAVSRLSDTAQDEGRDEDGVRLGEHLMMMVGRGVLAWSDPDRLVQRFFESAPVHAAAQAVAFIGRSLLEAHQQMGPKVVNRFCALWQDLSTRLLAEGASRQPILKPFGWWFACSALEPHWALSQLKIVLEAGCGVDPEHMVLERLRGLSAMYPAESVALLRTVVERGNDRWGVLAANESVQEILQTGLGSHATHAEAVALIHELGARGYSDFRALLQK